MKEITIEDIATQVKYLVDRSVNTAKGDDKKWKNHYRSIIFDLDDEIRLIEELMVDFTEEKLSINLIEQEGYLRCLKTMVNRFKEWDNYIKEDDDEVER